ncbi:NAC transcription factor NAM-B2-like [Salvia miltiorrhiza]|uniref:NAC transcription factor NAM-B2-like n=1 Tax=Salvia miltiorrhiza TaxID=226208 RepID=UPI0025ABB20B|nr:NAC transcription factor NAM-B2-like [Salvia miltiorrhiza]XP_057785857.1 NAC transcription factor NAM-B2-like [Salvia miltiorrhiza]XP_057793181.1 NAC transcription factor NAM-B2-like [Salvia miltiorrhiza]
MGFELPWDGILDRDVYGDGAEPWNVFSDADDAYWHTKKEGGATKKTIYVFTKLTKATSKSTRNSRIAGCGTWSGQTGPKDITHSDTGEIIGCMRMLTFKCSKAADKDSGHWNMHEYALTDAGLTATGLTSTDLVLCKITKTIKKASEVPAPFCFPLIDSGTPTTTGKRGGGDIEQEGCKRPKCSGEGFLEAAIMDDFNLDGIDLDKLYFDFSSTDFESLL